MPRETRPVAALRSMRKCQQAHPAQSKVRHHPDPFPTFRRRPRPRPPPRAQKGRGRTCSTIRNLVKPWLTNPCEPACRRWPPASRRCRLRVCKSIEPAQECPLESLAFSGAIGALRAFFHRLSGGKEGFEDQGQDTGVGGACDPFRQHAFQGFDLAKPPRIDSIPPSKSS